MEYQQTGDRFALKAFWPGVESAGEVAANERVAKHGGCPNVLPCIGQPAVAKPDGLEFKEELLFPLAQGGTLLAAVR